MTTFLNKLVKVSGVLGAAMIGTAAVAQDADPMIDVNGDGFYSFPELATVYDDVTDVTFSEMDTTDDGLLDMAEVAAALEAGLLPAEE